MNYVLVDLIKNINIAMEIMNKFFIIILINFLHKSKKTWEFLEKTKPSRAAYSDVAEERWQVWTTKSPARSIYAGSLIKGW